MFIKEVNFYRSVTLDSQDVFFEKKKEIAFVWRSNVGKSSLMNTIFWKKDLVRTSSKPWKTREANLFVVNNKYYFTDLPWYWFAKLWKDLKEGLDSLISWYLEERKHSIKCVVILVDSRLGTQEKDLEMYKYLLELDLPVLVVLSKIDKLSNNEVSKSLASTTKDFFWQTVIPVSSNTQAWIHELEKALKLALQNDKK